MQTSLLKYLRPQRQKPKNWLDELEIDPSPPEEPHEDTELLERLSQYVEEKLKRVPEDKRLDALAEMCKVVGRVLRGVKLPSDWQG